MVLNSSSRDCVATRALTLVTVATLTSLALLFGIEELQAQVVSPTAGVSFTLPPGFASQSDAPPPIAMLWRNETGTVSIAAVVLNYPNDDAAAAAAEFQDWPAVGRSMASSFGESSARMLGKQQGVRCSFDGLPLRQDQSRMAMEVRVEVTCPTSPSPLVVRSVLINVLARNQQLLLRIDAYPAAGAAQDSVAAEIWNTLTVAADERIATVGGVEISGRVRQVHGGPGVRLRDYGLIRPSFLIGEAVGSVVGALVFGALFTLVLLKLHVRPIPAALVAQLIVIALRMIGGEHDGVWEVDWLISFPSSLIAFLYLVRWAQRRPEANRVGQVGS